ncbi:uncharacterized protein LOC127880837 [Dreissena polymorpha]|uniref:Protein sleepless n=1 Tax=Dreissena polymorpha TaxID=45954 RepID=A0A9D4GP26_DREPO|nr:uncharacterized protein LOC127880836 isoform X2 [Dreissena polymorpha]XP_052284255.1 uncharacterized protein LOC127880837 [Dreissena polymorpha]KAH3820525.1 hypothetical protein DPMN_122269 [Dreissena polymorpha]
MPIPSRLFVPLILFPVIWNPEFVEMKSADEKSAGGLDCFECFSFNNSDPSCGDPFHPAYGVYSKNCLQGKKGHVGGFPSKYCIKLIGETYKDNIEMVYRGCSLDTLNNVCGDFRFEDVKYHGCITSCSENGCNHGVESRGDAHAYFYVNVMLFLIYITDTKLY